MKYFIDSKKRGFIKGGGVAITEGLINRTEIKNDSTLTTCSSKTLTKVNKLNENFNKL